MSRRLLLALGWTTLGSTVPKALKTSYMGTKKNAGALRYSTSGAAAGALICSSRCQARNYSTFVFMLCAVCVLAPEL